MSWTKGQLVLKAFDNDALAAFVYNLSAEQLQSALETLDALMAEWNMTGIQLGFPLPSKPGNSGLQELSGIPDGANSAVYSELAIRLCPSYGKVAPPELKTTARRGYNAVCTIASKPPTLQYPSNFPAGAGNQRSRYGDPFLTPPVTPVTSPVPSIDFE